jgi:hypothetical protein
MLIVFALKQQINMFGMIKSKMETYTVIFEIKEKFIENVAYQKTKEGK